MFSTDLFMKTFEEDFAWANNQMLEIIDIVSQDPRNMKFAWGVISKIYDILLPIGYMLIVLYFLMEFLKQNTDFHNISMEKTASMVVKLVIAKVIMDSSFNLLMAIFAFTNGLLSSISTSTGQMPMFDPNTIREMIDAMSTFDKMFFGFRMLTFGIIMNFTRIIIHAIIYGRFIELFVLTAFAPIPLSCIVSGELNQTSKRYLQEFFAVSLQGVIMIGIVLIYGGIVQEFMSNGWGITGIITSSILLAMMLFKSGSIARKLTGA